MKKYIAVFEVEDDCNILTIDAEVNYTYEENGTNYELREGIEFKRVEEPEQKTEEDCISRQAVLETIEDCNSDGLKGIFCSYNDGERFKSYIKDLPSVTPTEKTGEWEVYMSEEGKSRRCTCKLCGYKTGPYTWENPKYCAGCGARMINSPQNTIEDEEVKIKPAGETWTNEEIEKVLKYPFG